MWYTVDESDSLPECVFVRVYVCVHVRVRVWLSGRTFLYFKSLSPGQDVVMER